METKRHFPFRHLQLLFSIILPLPICHLFVVSLIRSNGVLVTDGFLAQLGQGNTGEGDGGQVGGVRGPGGQLEVVSGDMVGISLELEGNRFMMELWLEEWGCMWFSPSIFWAAACWTARGLSSAPGAKITTSVSARMASASSTVSIPLVAGPTWFFISWSSSIPSLGSFSCFTSFFWLLSVSPSMLEPSLATFWNSLSSNSGRTEIAYSSTPSVR